MANKETRYIKNTLNCKDWSSNDMIQCADEIVTKSSAKYDCQLPMSIKIGKLEKIYRKAIKKCISPHALEIPFICLSSNLSLFKPPCRDIGNDFVRFSVPFLDGRISDIHAACNSNVHFCAMSSRQCID